LSPASVDLLDMSADNIYLRVDKALISEAEARAIFLNEQSHQALATNDGRGCVWLIKGAFGEAVLKRYRRGGLIGKVLKQSYRWSSAETTRSLAEFELLTQLRAKGLNVPKPIAAMAKRGGFFYQAMILTERIAAQRSLQQWVREEIATAPWELVGQTVAKLHKLGAQHADLNASNILFDANNTAWVIDWDKGAIRPYDEQWTTAVLMRLKRGLMKYRGTHSEAEVEKGFEHLMNAYRKAMIEPGKTAA
jgi:3-deoxy-D-manno-octulosonic acid kinase